MKKNQKTRLFMKKNRSMSDPPTLPKFAPTRALIRSVQLLIWARNNGCAWNGPAVCNRAARGGHMGILKYARENGCSWDASTCIGAAEGALPQSNVSKSLTACLRRSSIRVGGAWVLANNRIVLLMRGTCGPLMRHNSVQRHL